MTNQESHITAIECCRLLRKLGQQLSDMEMKRQAMDVQECEGIVLNIAHLLLPAKKKRAIESNP